MCLCILCWGAEDEAWGGTTHSPGSAAWTHPVAMLVSTVGNRRQPICFLMVTVRLAAPLLRNQESLGVLAAPAPGPTHPPTLHPQISIHNSEMVLNGERDTDVNGKNSWLEW